MIHNTRIYPNELEYISDLCPKLFRFEGNISLRRVGIASLTKTEVFMTCKCILMEKWRNMDEFRVKIFSNETVSVGVAIVIATISMYKSLNVPLHL